jgi:methionine sulfoxide reductase heme-binding subunit
MSISEAMSAGARGPANSSHSPTEGNIRRSFIDRQRWIFWLLLGLPLANLVLATFTGGLGANPVETLTHESGEWALRCLLLSLSMTPLRALTGWNWPPRLRRALGVWAFVYALLHFSVWWLFDHQLDFAAMARDVVKRPWITIGFATFVMLTPLALTSTNRMMKRLGGRRWKQLHRIAYPAGAAAVLHFWWLVKADVAEPAIYAMLLASGFLLRLRPLRRA